MIRREIRKHERLTRGLRRVRRLWQGSRLPDRIHPPESYPTDFRIRRTPRAVAADWPEPPVIDAPFSATSGDQPQPAPRRYDLALFEELNAEYRDRPVAATAPQYDAASIAERSRQRLGAIHERIDLADQTVLEIGCGAGYEIWYLAHHFGSDAWGIDISPRVAWPFLAGDRVHLIEGDVAARGSLPSDTFDRVLSFTVWEHITHPAEAIVELERIMKPGALAWVRANLYRGPTASHQTRHIAFPFPHLLFADDVIDEGLRRAGKPNSGGAAWVNRMTWEQYEAAFASVGLQIRSLTFTRYPLDDSFYRRFEDVLGRYPRADLERGFFQVILEKPTAS